MVKSQATQALLQKLDQARLKVLCESANSLLNKPIDPLEIPTVALMMRILSQVVVEKFKSKYAYDFQRFEPKPPNVADDATLNIGSAEQLCSIKDANEISGYVDSVILKSLEPVWARDPAKADLVAQGNTIFKEEPKDSWNATFLDSLYDSKQPDTNLAKIDAVLVHCTILIDKKQYAVIYYAGVYYQTLSPQRAAENKLLATLIENAKKLVGQLQTPDTSIQCLKTILRGYTKKIFQEHYGFPYDDDQTSPKDKAPGAELHSAGGICLIKNGESAAVNSFIDDILNIIYLPSYAKDNGHKNLLNEANGLLQKDTGGGWQQAFFTQTYENPILGNNSYRTTAVFVYANGILQEGSITAKISILYYLGVYYGTFGPLAVAETTFLANLYQAAKRLVPDHPSIDHPPTIVDLDDILKDAGESKFQAFFSVPYKGDQTVPGDILEGTKAQGISVLLLVENGDENALQDAAQFYILQNIAFPNWAQDPTSQRLQKFLVTFLKFPSGFNWNTNKTIIPVFEKDKAFKTISTVTFCNAQFKEGDISLNVSFIYFVGVFYFAPKVNVTDETSQ